VVNDIWVTVSGNVVDDPSKRETAGAPVKFRLASTPAYMRDGAWMDSDTNYFDVACWERLGEHILECVRRGDPVLVHGRLSIREWEGENGRGRTAEIRAQHVGFDLKRRKALVERLPRTGREETQVTPPVAPALGSGAEDEAVATLAEPAA
jgi:single-strand DNA-binding protein